MSGEDQIRRGMEYITRNYGTAAVSARTYSSPPLPASYSIITGVPAPDPDGVWIKTEPTGMGASWVWGAVAGFVLACAAAVALVVFLT